MTLASVRGVVATPNLCGDLVRIWSNKHSASPRAPRTLATFKYARRRAAAVSRAVALLALPPSRLSAQVRRAGSHGEHIQGTVRPLAVNQRRLLACMPHTQAQPAAAGEADVSVSAHSRVLWGCLVLWRRRLLWRGRSVPFWGLCGGPLLCSAPFSSAASEGRGHRVGPVWLWQGAALVSVHGGET